MNAQQAYKYRYLLINLGKGIAWLAFILLVFFLFKTYLTETYDDLMSHIANKPLLVISVFIVSEVMFGIIPPELFMIWALHQGSIGNYIIYVFMLALLSYISGILGYYFGYQFSKIELYMKFKEWIGNKFEKNVRRFGGFMVFIAAVTPIPFSAICMIAGAGRFKFMTFILVSVSRFLRFLLYGYVIWYVDQI